ncbi:MAG: protein tyrosine phosphatase family protein [Woeseiaceae bacterium]|nr:protein tyrosine phosphatase family protein [Woeseiaceae bacterium]
MSMRSALLLLHVAAIALAAHAEAAVEDIVNFRAYSPGFASAGQPTAEQLGELADAGFERIVYIAYSDQRSALEHEDRRVKELGMEYVHIPVDWEAPTAADFSLIAAAIEQAPARKTLLHCQVNYRASAFAFLYRVLYEGVPIAAAKADMNGVWAPNETWRSLIFDVLEANGVPPDCEGCDWSDEDE